MAPPIKPLEARFMSFVLVSPSGCWLWQGTKNKDGYGKIWVQETKSQSTAHRVSMMLFRDEIPTGKMVCHTCDIPSCVNPLHLYIGNGYTNQQDAVSRKRHRESRKTHCAKGHEYTEKNTYLWNNTRHCISCRKGRTK